MASTAVSTACGYAALFLLNCKIAQTIERASNTIELSVMVSNCVAVDSCGALRTNEIHNTAGFGCQRLFSDVLFTVIPRVVDGRPHSPSVQRSLDC